MIPCIAGYNGSALIRKCSFSKAVKKLLTNEQIKECLKPENYTGHSKDIIDKVLGSL